MSDKLYIYGWPLFSGFNGEYVKSSSMRWERNLGDKICFINNYCGYWCIGSYTKEDGDVIYAKSNYKLGKWESDFVVSEESSHPLTAFCIFRNPIDYYCI